MAIELAKICRVAIDLGKHGKEFVDPEILKPFYNALDNKYPDFMEKPDK